MIAVVLLTEDSLGMGLPGVLLVLRIFGNK
jgi:hypothetical protein